MQTKTKKTLVFEPKIKVKDASEKKLKQVAEKWSKEVKPTASLWVNFSNQREK